MASVLSGVKRTFSMASADWDGSTGQHRSESESKAAQAAQAAQTASATASPPATKAAVVTPKPHTHAQLPAHNDRPASRPSGTESGRHSPQPSAPSTPALSHSPGPGRPHFDADASVILTGVRGAGKSTLAVIASTALRRKIVEADKVFHDAHALSSAAFQREHGVLAYRRAQAAVLNQILEVHHHGAIIVCSWMERDVQARLSQCAAMSPIILILRDTAAIQAHLRVWDDARVQELVTASGPVFRRCAQFEFYNISEVPSSGASATTESGNDDDDVRTPAPYLTLKRAERHFLKFLSLILPRGAIPFFESAYPLAALPTETRRFTYALRIRLADFTSSEIDVEDIEAGADAIELVVDLPLQGPFSQPLMPQAADNISRVVSHIRRSTVIPIIFHVVLPEGNCTHTQKNDSVRTMYLSHVLHGLRLAPDYVTVDLRLPDADIAHIRATAWTSKIVGHVHMDNTPPSWHDPMWLSYYRRAVSFGFQAARLTRRAASLDENFDVSHFIYTTKSPQLQTSQIPLIAYNTGPKGRFSACFNSVLTSVVPEPPSASLKSSKALEEDSDSMDTDSRSTTPRSGHPLSLDKDISTSTELTSRQASMALSSAFVYEPMRLYVFGAYVDYSVSPAMHNNALKVCGLPHIYRPKSIDSVEHIRSLIHDPHFGGASVGLPFKVTAIRLTQSLSSHARAVGAINTLIPIRHLQEDGSMPSYSEILTSRNQSGPVLAIYGENTDWIGIRACIRRGLSPANAVRPGSVGLVIGAGGMARAAVYAMLQLGVKQIVVSNRTMANAEQMVAHFSGMLERGEMQLLADDSPTVDFHVMRTQQDPWPASFRKPTMIISCIPTHRIGLVPSPNLTLPPAWFGSPTGGVLVELAYKTLQTPLLDQSRQLAQQGWVSMDGLDLLPEQGFAQFELFTGRRAPRRLMREEVFRAHKDEQGRSNLPQLQTRLDNIVHQEP
ncbi:hypothetical protein SCUCBS95973_008219 [Sporothrix curviconia]|uniref:Quinate repressor protein n=1 Tax=Sporothrix curviconia TaxID=1260050 RepID=A0ABP0CJP3_9PEZI